MRHVTHPSRVPRVLASLLALGGSACATGMPQVDPADIPRLEREIAANPQDTDLQVRLGMAQFQAETYDQALRTLQAAVDAGNESGPALLYLGLTQEEFENWSAARDAYSRYLATGARGPVEEQIRKRLELIAQNALKQQARAALAQEAQLSGAAPTPRSLAVLPFGFNSERADLEPLIYALSDMMITDFAVTNALTVLERSQIQTLLDEMSLTEAGYAEPATGARTGRLLRAEHVVQGVLTTLGEQNLRVDTDVLNIPRSASAGTLTSEDVLDKLFDIEKDVVFRTLRDVLGVQLTPAEEQQIRDNRAANILAFLAYGRGLRARDQGDYEAALAAFRQAQDLDPGFGAAAAAVSETENMSDAAGTSTSQVAAIGAPPPPPTAGTLGWASEGVNPTPTTGTLDKGSTLATGQEQASSSVEKRDPVQESQGQESVTKPATAQIRIVIKRPGGGDQ
ncbi:MAG: tetratricopeptide repeat protein [Gemmatimonadetes bacterium]|nr:tetratricopeptide repeat protein [Gemmatimonadota bacterium]